MCGYRTTYRPYTEIQSLYVSCTDNAAAFRPYRQADIGQPLETGPNQVTRTLAVFRGKVRFSVLAAKTT